ncbi:MAG: hypothetical protein JWL90_435, partial [Chthoniobacteraceae bacterium]|nr:hypothetical protein [Chthoniobacteraceae bacterium]
AVRFFQQNRLPGITDDLARLERKVDQIATAPTPESVAATFATVYRGDFYEEATRFYDLLACPSAKTKTGWGTYHRALLEVVRNARKAGNMDISTLDPWAKIELLGPSGLWAEFKTTHPGSSSLDQFMFYLRKLVPDFISKAFFPPHFSQNLETVRCPAGSEYRNSFNCAILLAEAGVDRRAQLLPGYGNWWRTPRLESRFGRAGGNWPDNRRGFGPSSDTCSRTQCT